MKYFTIATLFAVSYGLDLSLYEQRYPTVGNLAQLNTHPDDIEWGDAAPTLTSGNCAEDCTECRKDLSTDEFECKDTTVYKYKNLCNPKRLKKEGKENLCMTGDQPCHWSFPADSNKNSPDATCRTLPDSYLGEEWHYSSMISDKMKGQCPKEGCPTPEGYEDFWENGLCVKSWPEDSDQSDAKTMFRCVPLDQYSDYAL